MTAGACSDPSVSKRVWLPRMERSSRLLCDSVAGHSPATTGTALDQRKKSSSIIQLYVVHDTRNNHAVGL